MGRFNPNYDEYYSVEADAQADCETFFVSGLSTDIKKTCKAHKVTKQKIFMTSSGISVSNLLNQVDKALRKIGYVTFYSNNNEARYQSQYGDGVCYVNNNPTSGKLSIEFY